MAKVRIINHLLSKINQNYSNLSKETHLIIEHPQILNKMIGILRGCLIEIRLPLQ